VSNVIQFAPAVKAVDLPRAAWVYEQRLLDRVEVDDNGCWRWQGPLNPGGYGQITAWGTRWLIHRLAYVVMVGPFDLSLQIDHVCRVRNCISPFDLEPVTQAENLRRQGKAVYVCPDGHPYTPENTYRAPGSPSQRRCRTCTYLRNQKAPRRSRAKAVAA
jgi:hypothetical protein